MTEPTSVIGLDRRGDRWLVAQVRHESGRPIIHRLERCDPAALLERDDPATESVTTLAVPDNLALVKPIRTGESGDRDNLAAFEMTQAMLADENEFVFHTFPTALEQLTIGTAVRRAVLEREVIDPYRQLSGTTVAPVTTLRAIALARGYATYAVAESGDLTALIDLGCEPISLCLIHGGRPAAIGHIAADCFDLETERGRERLAIELKTVINFKLASLFEYGLTLPLAGLTVAGDSPDDLLMAALRRYFSVRVTRPRLNDGFRADPETADPADGDFLGVLGLTAI